jgi:mono/diheme cytochrome c family protein
MGAADIQMEHSMFQRLAVLLAVCLVGGPALAQDPRAQRGRVFAQTNCASCHAIGRVGESPLRPAPPFRTLHTRYPVEQLAEALAEGIVTGHPSMPQFQLDVAQIGDLIAYLRTLEN